MFSHSSSELSNTKFHRLYDIISSSLLDVKIMCFLYSGQVDNRLLSFPLNKIWMPLLSTWVRCNIEESTRIPYQFNYGEDIFLSFTMYRKTHSMDPRTHTTVLPINNFSSLNTLSIQFFRLLIHSVWTSTISLYSSSEKDKHPVSKKLEQWQIGSSE